jgi:hypothetical protein
MRSIFVPSMASQFCDSDCWRRKKGGVDGLGKLRSGVKRNGAILTALFCGFQGVMFLLGLFVGMALP